MSGATCGNGAYPGYRFAHPGNTSALRWRERLHDLLKRRQRFAMRGVGGERGIARRVEQVRMRLQGEAHEAGDDDVRMADALAEQIRRPHRRALLFQHREHARYLRLAPLDPELELLLAQHALIDQADRFVRKPARERAEPQVMPPLGAAGGDHRLRLARELVKI